MKKLICFLITIILLATTQSFAQQSPEKLDYLNKVDKYRKMKSTGATLTVLGGVLVGIGAAIMYNSSYDWWTGEETGNRQAGALCTVFGIAGLGSGIPLWAVGAHNQRKYNEKLQGLSVRINASPQSSGLKLSYRF
jgi:uncharacterized membrane protein YedE/YeeE